MYSCLFLHLMKIFMGLKDAIAFVIPIIATLRFLYSLMYLWITLKINLFPYL